MTSDGSILDAFPFAQRLERGELLFFPVCPFRLPEGDDTAFLLAQPGAALAWQESRFDAEDEELQGPQPADSPDGERLTRLLNEFSSHATDWLADKLPEYAGAWSRDRAVLRSEEEATRRRRVHERTDLLHIDSFPERPAVGRRILRLFVNINPHEPRVWQTSEGFSALLDRFARRNRIPALSEREWCAPLNVFQRLLQRDWAGRSPYDSFMLKLQQSLRADDTFQEKSARRIWHFPPGSAWLLFTDDLSHAELRGQHALEQSYFVPQHTLVRPELAPLRQLVKAGEPVHVRRAA